MVMTVASGEFGDDDPDREEADRRLDVRAVGDGEPLVGLSQEVVKPHRGAQRRHETAEAIPEGSDRHDDSHEDQGRRGVRKVRAERNEEGSDTEWQDDGSGEGKRISIRTESVHSCLASIK